MWNYEHRDFEHVDAVLSFEKMNTRGTEADTGSLLPETPTQLRAGEFGRRLKAARVRRRGRLRESSFCIANAFDVLSDSENVVLTSVARS